MIEYLYIDLPRLDRYYEQISAPVDYDKVPIWNVAFSLAGPKVESTQARPARDPTTHEKIQRFVEYVSEHDLASDKRGIIEIRDKKNVPFVGETFLANRAQIERGDQKLNIWISLQPEDPHLKGGRPAGALYLIEDFRGDDDHFHNYSGYSSLYLLAEELAWLKPTPIGKPFEELRNQPDVTRAFALDPMGTLASMGARIGPERRIKALYRMRSRCIEMEGEEYRAFTTIGYPIVIQEA